MDGSILRLSWTTINDYVGSGKRPYKEGEAVLDANHIICCGYKSKSSTELLVNAVCLKTSALMQPPHNISISLKILQDDRNVCISSCYCGCKAGSGNCKHIVAVLMLLNRFVCLYILFIYLLMNYMESQKIKVLTKTVPIELHFNFWYIYPFCRSLDLEDISCTDMEQEWGKIKSNTKKMYEAGPLAATFHCKAPSNPYLEPEIEEPSEQVATCFMNWLLKSKISEQWHLGSNII
jgi:hypothetical protein